MAGGIGSPIAGSVYLESSILAKPTPVRPRSHKRPIAKILTASPSLLPQQSLAMLWMPAGASQLRDSLSLSGARSNRSNKGAIRRHLRPQSGSTSGASSRWEEAGRGAEGQAGAHICDELATEAGLSGRRCRPPVGRALCAPSADEFRRGCSANRHSGVGACELAELASRALGRLWPVGWRHTFPSRCQFAAALHRPKLRAGRAALFCLH